MSIEDRNLHMSGANQWYWRMRGAFEDRYNGAGGSVCALSIASGAPVKTTADNTRAMGIIASWERDGIATPPYEAPEDGHIDRLLSTINDIENTWKNELRPIHETDGLYDKTIALVERARDGNLTTTEDFQSMVQGCERAIIFMQPERYGRSEARDGHFALHRAAHGILREQPHILEELRKPLGAEKDSLIETLTDHEISSDQMNVLRMSAGTGKDPAEVIGICLATGLISPNDPMLEQYTSQRFHKAAAEAQAVAPAMVAADAISALSETPVPREDRVKLAALRRSVDGGELHGGVAVELNDIASRGALNIDTKDELTASLFGLQARLIKDTPQKSRSSIREDDQR